MTTIAPPPAPVPPELSSGGRTGIRVALVALAIFAMACSVISLTVIAFGLSTFRVITDTQKLPQSMRWLSVDSADVPVTVRVITDAGASEPRVDLRMLTSTRENTRRLIVASDADGTRVTLGTPGVPYLPCRRLGEITVLLPPNIARELNVTTRSNSRDDHVDDWC
jgi:hypothetical protein